MSDSEHQGQSVCPPTTLKVWICDACGEPRAAVDLSRITGDGPWCLRCSGPMTEFTYIAEVERLTSHEARALRLASIFGTPDPTPPEIESALRKIKAIEVTDA